MSENDKPEWLEHLSVLRLEPGDTLVLRLQQVLTIREARNIGAQFEKLFPGHRCIVLQEGMEVGVVREKQPKAEDQTVASP